MPLLLYDCRLCIWYKFAMVYHYETSVLLGYCRHWCQLCFTSPVTLPQHLRETSSSCFHSPLLVLLCVYMFVVAVSEFLTSHSAVPLSSQLRLPAGTSHPPVHWQQLHGRDAGRPEAPHPNHHASGSHAPCSKRQVSYPVTVPFLGLNSQTTVCDS